MKKEFQSRTEAIAWITANARSQAHLDVLKKELNFNYIFSGQYIIDLLEVTYAVALVK